MFNPALLLQDVFDVTALQQFTLDSASAVEFYEVYKVRICALVGI